MALYCKNCKKEVPDGSFCPSCGKILDSFVSYAETQRQVQKEIEDEENGKQLKLYFGRHKHFVDFYSKGKEILGLLVFIIVFATIVFFAHRIFIDEEVDMIGRLYLYAALSIPTLSALVIFFFFIKSVISTYLASIAKCIGKEYTAKITNSFVKESQKITPKTSEMVYAYYIVYEYNIGNFLHQTTQRVSQKTFYDLHSGDDITIKRSHLIGVYIEQKMY